MDASNKFEDDSLHVKIKKELADKLINLGKTAGSVVEELLEEYLASNVKPNRFEYMVIYNAPNQIGRCAITRYRLLNSYDDLVELDEYVKTIGEGNPDKLFVTDFKLLRSYYEEVI